MPDDIELPAPDGFITAPAPGWQRTVGAYMGRTVCRLIAERVAAAVAAERVRAVPDGDPSGAGWYVVTADHLDGPKVRAFGKDGQWWIPLGRGDGKDGWMTAPNGYRWFGPIADIDAPQPFNDPQAPPADAQAEARDAWVSVSERLPPDGAAALCLLGDGTCEVLVRSGDGWKTQEAVPWDCVATPTDWQPLPALPEGAAK